MVNIRAAEIRPQPFIHPRLRFRCMSCCMFDIRHDGRVISDHVETKRAINAFLVKAHT